MSQINYSHRIDQLNNLKGISLVYLETYLGPWKKCPKSKCTGYMTEVFARYFDHGPINKELECSTCGKVIKDPLFRNSNPRKQKEYRKNNYNNNRKRGKNDTKTRR